jgi:hypothetical protein
MIGVRCRILLGDFAGDVVGKRSYLGEQDRYAVRYLDDSGPQERWFTAGEITFTRHEAKAMSHGAKPHGNVVDLRR